MPQPTPYDRLTNFQNDQALAPVDPYPAPKIDQEYNAIKITIDEILQNLALIQRDDGQLANGSVGWDQLKDEVLVGFGPPEPWETAHLYRVGNTVFEDDGFYLCIVEHTSGVFADDLAAGKWSLIVDFAAHTAAAEAAAAAAEAAAAEAAESALDASAAQGAFRWNFDSSTAMSDPGVGDVRGNGTPASAVTMIAISGQTADIGNPNILPWLLTWDDSTSPVRGTIFIRKVADPDIFAVFNITGPIFNNSTWVQISVSYIVHSGTLVNGEPVSVAFMRTGNQGVNGPGTGDMVGANNLTDVANAATSLANIGGVAKAGDTMEGHLSLLTGPSAANAVRKDYVDTADGNRVAKAGDTMTGPLMLSGAIPVQGAEATHKAYVDATAYAMIRRNRIINGAMQISQEWGNTQRGPATVFSNYMADQWSTEVNLPFGGATTQRVQVNTLQGSVNRIRVTVTIGSPSAGSSFLGIYQAIEGAAMADFFYGSATARQSVLRFGWKSPAGIYSVGIRNGAFNRSYVANFTIAAGQANTDTLQALVIPGDVTGTWARDTAVGMSIFFTMHAGAALVGVAGWQAGSRLSTASNTNGAETTGNVFELFDVALHLDVGNTGIAPPWEMPSEIEEMTKCQRYYEVGFYGLSNAAYSLAGQTLAGAVSYKAIKRATPTITYFNTSYTNTTGIIVALNNTMGLYIGVGTTVAGSTSDFYTNFYANARLS